MIRLTRTSVWTKNTILGQESPSGTRAALHGGFLIFKSIHLRKLILCPPRLSQNQRNFSGARASSSGHHPRPDFFVPGYREWRAYHVHNRTRQRNVRYLFSFRPFRKPRHLRAACSRQPCTCSQSVQTTLAIQGFAIHGQRCGLRRYGPRHQCDRGARNGTHFSLIEQASDLS